MLIRVIAIVAVSSALLCGCATNKQAAQNESNSMIRKADNDSQVHGEVGFMYGSGSLSRH